MRRKTQGKNSQKSKKKAKGMSGHLASGSGKTTLLRLIAGLETLAAGRIFIAGQQVAGPSRHVPPEGRAVGFVFQDYALFPHLNVANNVLFGMPRRPRRERLARLGQLLHSVGMSDFAGAMPHTLSGGQQQRVALARALAREPTAMLMDEPFSGLDARLREEIRELTLQVLRAAGVATLLVTHDPQEALLASDVVSVIRNGRIEQTGAPRQLYFQPHSLQVAKVFGPVNRFSGTVEAGRVATPFGSIDAPSSQPGERVAVLWRPESLVLHERPTPDSVPATVRHNCLRGETSSVVLELSTGETVVVWTSSFWNSAAGAEVHVASLPQGAVVVPDRE